MIARLFALCLCLFIFLFVSSPIYAAVAFVTSGHEKSQSTAPTVNIVVGAGDTNPYIHVNITLDHSTVLVTSVTSNLSTGTIAQIALVRSAIGTTTTYSFKVPAPVVGTHTITANINTSAIDHQLDVQLFKGVDQSDPSPVVDAVTSQATTDPLTVNALNVTSNDAVSGISGTTNGDVVAITTGVETYNDDFTNVNVLSGYRLGSDGTSGITFDYSGATTQAVIVSRIVSFSAGGGPTCKGTLLLLGVGGC